MFANPEPSTSDSESDLSEALDVPNASTLSSNAEAQGFDVNSESRRINTGSSHEEDAVGSDDADCSIETPVLTTLNIARDDPSSSEESRRTAKRKAGVEQDDHMINNPELYGLRRSVNQMLDSTRNLLTWIRVVLVRPAVL